MHCHTLSHAVARLPPSTALSTSLLATALGLVAAIPASIAYNKFANDLGILANKLEDFAEEFSSLLSEHLESKG